jgi:hypothetical protein
VTEGMDELENDRYSASPKIIHWGIFGGGI